MVSLIVDKPYRGPARIGGYPPQVKTAMIE
jgi:hypothetical protein